MKYLVKKLLKKPTLVYQVKVEDFLMKFTSEVGRNWMLLFSVKLKVNNNLRYSCWLHTKAGPSKVGNVITPSGPWMTSGPLSRRCSRKYL